MPTGTLIPSGTELHFGNEGLGYYEGEQVKLSSIPAVALEDKKLWGNIVEFDDDTIKNMPINKLVKLYTSCNNALSKIDPTTGRDYPVIMRKRKAESDLMSYLTKIRKLRPEVSKH